MSTDVNSVTCDTNRYGLKCPQFASRNVFGAGPVASISTAQDRHCNQRFEREGIYRRCAGDMPSMCYSWRPELQGLEVPAKLLAGKPVFGSPDNLIRE